MSVYIVRPRRTRAMGSLSLMSRKFTAASRTAQVQEVFSQHMADPVGKDIRAWVDDARGRGVKRLTRQETATQITGTTLVEMADEEAEKMRQELPDAVVIQDQPLNLIRPRRTAAAKKKVSARDLWHLSAIGLAAARKKGFKGSGKGVTVAVLDTGVDETHPELAGKVAGAYTFDVTEWVARPMRPAEDTDGHGTHVAGLICGKKVGVAPGASVMSGVMIPEGCGNLSDFILALEWAGTMPEIGVVNMSAGIPGYLPEMREAVAELSAVGVLPVFATGNEGRNRTRSPGNYNEVVSVGASNRRSRVAGFSSSGTLVADNHQYTVPDLVAPGQGVYSSVMGGGYEAWDGTSMATPVVSGVAALILEKEPQIEVPELMDVLLATCKELGVEVTRQGYGLVQVKAAL